MHGQNRSEYKARLRDEATAKKLAQKAQQWNLLSSELLKRRRDAKDMVSATWSDAGDGGTVGGTVVGSTNATALETLELTEKLLSVNPDPAYLWNHRMELLLSLTSDGSDADGSPTASLTPAAFIRLERQMTTTCLQRNPKAYGAWFHRKWAVRHWMRTVRRPHDHRRELLRNELQRCAEFLNLDERNFHCWSYRRFVVAAIAASLLARDDDPNGGADGLDGSWEDLRPKPVIAVRGSKVGPQIEGKRGRPPAAPPDAHQTREVLAVLSAEWDFSTDKIRQNFSNGSAFHHRSKLLPLLHPDASCTVRPELLAGELELVNNAVYTEPDDQTAWWYLTFVLVWADPHGSARGKLEGDGREEEEAYLRVLKEQFECVRELLEAEEGQCKWGLLGMNTIATIIYQRTDKGTDDSDNARGGHDWKKEAYGCLQALEALDPDRAVRYKNMMERFD